MKMRNKLNNIFNHLNSKIIGQKDVIEVVLTSIILNGHSIITGVPGLAKTLIINLVSKLFDLNFKRIQFTPDLMPSDILGSEVIDTDPKTNERFFKYKKGPIFSNIILADEINRTPPKTQAALLEAMQEKNVTVGGKSYKLDKPFIVFATRNPIEQEGTYPLPEAQLDRFMFSINIYYPDYKDELKIIRMNENDLEIDKSYKINQKDLLQLQKCVNKIPISDYHYKYGLNLVRMTRKEDKLSPDYVKNYLSWGVGPRGGQYLIKAARGFAYIEGKKKVERTHLDRAFNYIANHRIILNFQAEAENIDKNEILNKLIEDVKK
ncbi:MAG: MoxR family ATPase [Candidatus Mcinerneyibacterium aminivorans]|uniref:MoxR family ATPase n=1 Tax=Candidatus Mcinerneyibacterium aminivorans TaxID=2703815 RepID=A0A5D0MHX6_9BACT|nr:MAG: MoxR family ATPase [Candidatus Mcinerneyibacterium aminivorans]